MQDKIVKLEKVRWKDLNLFQNLKLKEMTVSAYEQLKNSLKNNDYIDPLKVWQETSGKIWVIDGHHRIKSFMEIEKTDKTIVIPEYINAVFINFANRKEAAKAVVIYSSQYAKTTEEGLYEYLHQEQIDFDEIKLDMNIPEIDISTFEQSYYRNIEDIVPESGENQGKLDHPIIIECPKCGYKIEK